MTERDTARERGRARARERERASYWERYSIVRVVWLDDCVFTALIVSRAQRRGNCVCGGDACSSAAWAEFDQGDHLRERGGLVSARVHAHIYTLKRAHTGRKLGEHCREGDRQRLMKTETAEVVNMRVGIRRDTRIFLEWGGRDIKPSIQRRPGSTVQARQKESFNHSIPKGKLDDPRCADCGGRTPGGEQAPARGLGEEEEEEEEEEEKEEEEEEMEEEEDEEEEDEEQ